MKIQGGAGSESDRDPDGTNPVPPQIEAVLLAIPLQRLSHTPLINCQPALHRAVIPLENIQCLHRNSQSQLCSSLVSV